MQEVDAERRIQILRGLPVDPPTSTDEVRTGDGRAERSGGVGRERKRRRIEGEDDTERDIRLAREGQAFTPARVDKGALKRKETSNEPLTDQAGHINLFPVEGSRHHGSKNPEAVAEAVKKRKEYEDQYTMRFSNAAGFKQAVGQKPWYQSIGGAVEQVEDVAGKDVWGNEDPRRKEREKLRATADDPLAMIQKGVQGLREVERERKKWKEEKERETRELAEAERRRVKRKKRSRDDDDLEGFRLDATVRDVSRTRHRHSHTEHKSRRRHGSRSGSKGRHHPQRYSDEFKLDTGWEAGPGGRYSTQFANV